MKISLTGKILTLTAACSLLAGLLSVVLLTRWTTDLADRRQRTLGEERVELMLRLCAQAEAARRDQVPLGDVQQALLASLRSTHFPTTEESTSYPMVFGARGAVLLHPHPTDGAGATLELGSAPSHGGGLRETLYVGADGLPRWSLAASFPPWDWTLAWSAPVAGASAEVRQLLDRLLVVQCVGAGLLTLLLYLLLRPTLGPLATLTSAADELARSDGGDSPGVRPSDDLGTLARTIVEMRDVVDRQVAAVRRSEKQYRELVESANSLILRWDKEGRVIYLNQYGLRLLGFSAAELVGRHVTGTIVPDADSAGHDLRSMIDDILRHPEKYALNENENLCKDGRRVRIQWTNRPIFDDEGRFQEILSVGTDITERQRLRSDLRRAQKMEAIGTLAGGVAHDFNNILSAIVGHADYAMLRSEPGSPVAEALRQVLRAAERARDLVQQILTFSRRTEQERRPVALAPIVKETLKLLRSSIPTTIEIREQVRSQAAALADPTRIHQVAMNLCTNAYQAMAERGGVLTVILREQTIDTEREGPGLRLPKGRYLVLEVADTGEGMDRNTAEKIFEPYFTTKGQGEGSGLGLAVVDGIVRDHHGGIEVDSVPGQGTTVRVYLPAVAGPGQVERPRPAPQPLTTGCEHILFVDDEDALRSVARRIFSDAGYRIEVCADAQVALDVFGEEPDRWDLVVTDLAMPGMSGEEFLLHLRAVRPELPVILCTGYSAMMNEERSRQLGATAFLPKPLAMSDLVHRVRRILDDEEPARSSPPLSN